MTQQHTSPDADDPAGAPAAAPIVTLGSSAPAGSAGSESTMTVLIAFGANFLVAVAKSWAAALTGLVIAFTGLALHQITGSATPDAIGSILVGVLLGVVAIVLIQRNREFLVGQEVSPQARSATLTALLALPDVERVTALRLEFIGPRQVYVVADIDLTGDDTETHLAVRLRALEAQIRRSPAVVDCTLSLSAPDEPSLAP